CVGLPSAGRRAIAVEVQALVAPTEGPTRRQVTGLDPRRFQLVAAVLSNLDPSLRRADLYGAASGGIRVEDPACDLAVAAALASASSGVAPPPSSAFVGEIGLTGRVRPVAAMGQRLSAAASAGIELVFSPPGTSSRKGIRLVLVEHVSDAVTWASARKRGTRQPARRPA
ncbi:MAG TPA: S16 family serine protease, partial [Actinomycetota bacterium]|nr:S16 family serine protease [Actinomycetota bacterium]